jgi:hypothetical protein
MVTDRKKDSDKTPVKQGPARVSSEPNKINASTPYDFNGKNLTPYGGWKRLRRRWGWFSSSGAKGARGWKRLAVSY